MKTNKIIYFLLALALLSCSKKDAEPAKSSAKNITSFAFNSLNPAVKASIDSVQHTIKATLPDGADASKLVPTFTISSKATVSPASGIVQDFTKPITYKVTAEDGTTQSYVVNVSVTKSSAKEIISFNLNARNGTKVPATITIDSLTKSITAVVKAGTDLVNLVPIIVISNKATISPSSGYGLDLTNPQNYTVTAEDGSQQTYTVIVTFESIINTNGTAYFGANDNKFYAIDIETGLKKWEVRTGDRIGSSPSVSDGMVFFGCSDKNIYALDAKTGEKKWSFTTGAEVISSPLILNNVLYVGSNDENIYAINIKNGTKLWSYKTISKVISSPVVYQGVLYVGCMQAETAIDGSFPNGVMYAIDSQTGKLQWEQSIGHITSSPDIANGILYVVAGYFDAYLIALKATNGEEVFTNKYYNYTYKTNSSPTIDNNTIYVGGGQNFLFSFDLKGERNWYTLLNGYTYGSSTNSSPTVSNGLVYIGSWDGKIHCLSAMTGVEKWSYYLGNGTSESTIVNSPTVANGYVYFGNNSYKDNNKVACIEASTGKKKWEYMVGASIYSSICVVDSKGNIFHSSISGAKN